MILSTAKTANKVLPSEENMEVVFPAVASPSYKVFRNLTNEVIFWQINADATSVAANNYQINPGEGFNGQDLQLMFRTALRISMLSVNGGLVEGLEWTTS